MDIVYINGKMWALSESAFRRHLDEDTRVPKGVDYKDLPILLYEFQRRRYVNGGREFTSDMGHCASISMQRWIPGIIERHQYREALAELFRGTDTVHMLKMRETYRHLSNAADRGDEAANTIHSIVVKRGGS